MKILLATLVLVSVHSSYAANPSQASADLKSPTMGQLKSDIKFQKTPEGVKVMAMVSGLKPGSVHGIHIHEKGECKGPGFESAGDHFNPTHHSHNAPGATSKHAGDLGNLVANDKGVAKTEVLIKEEKDVTLPTF